MIRSATVRCEALFVSSLQPSEPADIAQVESAIVAVARRFGDRGVAERVAQEFGDHPETAVARMRWARELAGVGTATPALAIAA